MNDNNKNGNNYRRNWNTITLNRSRERMTSFFNHVGIETEKGGKCFQRSS